MFEKPIARLEALLKGMVFDCHACGQCVLRQTGLICPMTCPKGLRNGPCGGTLDGRCEVYPDKRCVWVDIHHRIAGDDSLQLPPLLPSPDARLINTSSYLNYLSGQDEPGRTPLTYLDLGRDRTRQPVQTASALERRLKSGAFVRLCELRAPRSSSFEALEREASKICGHFDAVNATAYLNARPSLASPVVAARLAALGIEPISQATCRDHTKTSFIGELLQNQLNGVHNTLCLTGDSYKGQPKIKQVFDMDGALMLYEARHLREKGVVHFTGEAIADAPKPFLGAAINPYSTPLNVPIRRLKQKIAAGADFIQTQLIFDAQRFAAFMEAVRQEGLDREAFIIAGIPVVTWRGAIDLLTRIPGVHAPAWVLGRLDRATDVRAEGLALARQLIEDVSRIPGVAGVHLMLFGSDHAVLPPLVADLKQTIDSPGATAACPHETPPATVEEEQPCPSPS